MQRKLMIKDEKTAVVAIVVYEQKVLLLERNNPPYNWCPPCGRVCVGETLEEGLLREVKEETSLPVDILKYVSLWNGSYSSHEIRSFVFVCRAKTDKVVLSDEHSDYCWIEIKKLYQWRDRTDFDLTMWPQWIFSSEIELL